MRYFSKLTNAALLVFALALALVTAPVAEAQNTRTLQQPASVTFTFAQGTQTNQQFVTINVKDRFGTAIPGIAFDFYYSDSPSGIGVTATASSGTAGVVTTGFILGVTNATPTVATSRVSLRLVTDSTGAVKIGVIDTAKTNFFPVVQLPGGILAIGAKMTTANYL